MGVMRIVMGLLLAMAPAACGETCPSEDAPKHQQVKFYTAGTAKADTNALGGFAPSRNGPWDLDADLAEALDAPEGEVSVIVREKPDLGRGENPPALEVFVVNRAPETKRYSAQDSALQLRQEALDENGEWKPIEYLPPSWCGNSYHSVFIEPEQYWRWDVPRYEGDFETTLRYAFGRDRDPIHSNEFSGALDPALFTPAPTPDWMQR